MYYSARYKRQMEQWEEAGFNAYPQLKREDNPYIGATARQLWFQGWDFAYSSANPEPAFND